MTFQNAHKVISPDEFIFLVNEEMKNHFAYKQGMNAFLVPRGATGKTAQGYGFEPTSELPGVFADACHKVLSSHVVDRALAGIPGKS